MRKLKEFYEWCVAGLIVGFVGVSFLIGSISIIAQVVEVLSDIILK